MTNVNSLVFLEGFPKSDMGETKRGRLHALTAEEAKDQAREPKDFGGLQHSFCKKVIIIYLIYLLCLEITVSDFRGHETITRSSVVYLNNDCLCLLL